MDRGQRYATAQWLVRSLLVFSAMPVERAYLYFFNDEDQPRFHASAGITRHYQPKLPSMRSATCNVCSVTIAFKAS